MNQKRKTQELVSKLILFTVAVAVVAYVVTEYVLPWWQSLGK